MSPLTQSATKRKMLRQPSFRLAMAGMQSPKKHGGTSAFRAAWKLQLAGKVLFKNGDYDTVESKRAPRKKRGRDPSPTQEPSEAKTPTPQVHRGRRFRDYTSRRGHAFAHQKLAARRTESLGIEKRHPRLAELLSISRFCRSQSLCVLHRSQRFFVRQR